MHSKKQFVSKPFFEFKKGFTLAEVLVTLAIIGIVAALTIPSLIQNIQEQQYKTALKKTYSDISNALINLKEYRDGNLRGSFKAPDGSYCWDTDCFAPDIIKYLSVVKTCARGTVSGNCFTKKSEMLERTGDPTLGNFGGWFDIDDCYGAILSNGATIGISYPTGPQGEDWGWGRFFGFMAIDVNGFKKPNMVSKDLFYFHIMSDGTLKPFGIPGDWTACIGTDAWGCAVKVLTNTDY